MLSFSFMNISILSSFIQGHKVKGGTCVFEILQSQMVTPKTDNYAKVQLAAPKGDGMLSICTPKIDDVG